MNWGTGFSLRKVVDLEMVLLRQIVHINENIFSSSFVQDCKFNFPESRVAFPRYNQLLKPNINGWQRIFWRNRSSTTRSHTCQHYAEITQSHTFAALIRLSTTTHNLLTFNISEISSNNSGKLILLANKHIWTFPLP